VGIHFSVGSEFRLGDDGLKTARSIKQGSGAELKLAWGTFMDGWKKAVVVGSVGASAVLFLKKKWPAGVLMGGVALAVLASEYPEKFESVQNVLPEYFQKGMRLMEVVSRAGQKIAQFAEQGGQGIWDEISS
jgi:hypothetical protein